MGNVFSGRNDTVEIKNNNDIWDIIFEIKKEGDSYGITDMTGCITNIYAHLPLFACKNSVYSKDTQKAIERYIYCEKFGVPPFKGAYGDQPKKWIDTTFVIRNALAIKEDFEIKKIRANKGK